MPVVLKDVQVRQFLPSAPQSWMPMQSAITSHFALASSREPYHEEQLLSGRSLETLAPASYVYSGTHEPWQHSMESKQLLSKGLS